MLSPTMQVSNQFSGAAPPAASDEKQHYEPYEVCLQLRFNHNHHQATNPSPPPGLHNVANSVAMASLAAATVWPSAPLTPDKDHSQDDFPPFAPVVPPQPTAVVSRMGCVIPTAILQQTQQQLQQPPQQAQPLAQAAATHQLLESVQQQQSDHSAAQAEALAQLSVLRDAVQRLPFLVPSPADLLKEVENRIAVASKYLQAGNADHALFNYQVAAMLSPSNVDAYVGIAASLLRRGDNVSALQYYLEVGMCNRL